MDRTVIFGLCRSAPMACRLIIVMVRLYRATRSGTVPLQAGRSSRAMTMGEGLVDSIDFVRRLRIANCGNTLRSYSMTAARPLGFDGA